ncbi:MAG: hypothetical protein R2780_04465 [Crocinitomicaceae bacterium]|nr:hypothetical protein [Crocinitomicaceae bacterium]
MKKVMLAGILGVFALGMTSCGHGVCDAYNKSDYTKYKADHNKKVELVKALVQSKR